MLSIRNVSKPAFRELGARSRFSSTGGAVHAVLVVLHLVLSARSGFSSTGGSVHLVGFRRGTACRLYQLAAILAPGGRRHFVDARSTSPPVIPR